MMNQSQVRTNDKVNDQPEIREIFSRFHCKEVSLTYTIGTGDPVKADELIFSNFKLKEQAEPDLFADCA